MNFILVDQIYSIKHMKKYNKKSPGKLMSGD